MFERLIFLLSIAMIAFFGGMAASHFRTFPYPQVRDAARTAKALLSGDESTVAPMNRIGAAETSPDARWKRTGEADGSILVFGGYGQFTEFCPETGCLAVRFDASGEAVESWPFRLEEILQADRVGDSYPREFVRFDPLDQMYPIGIDRYADGDLLVTFQVRGNFFPFAGGVARVAPDGRPRWYRNDFSHHWPMILPDGTALVPTLRVGSGSVRVDPAGATPSSDMVLRCPSGRPQIDMLTVLAPDGTVKREIDLLAMVQASPWRTVLGATSNACDPLHLNFVDVTGREDTAGLPSRLVLSFRNISAFGIIDLETGTLEYLHRGSFAQQHAVHHLDGSRFILFDNLGADTAGPASRVVTVDIATGEERRVFPLIDDANPNPPPFTKNAGHIDLSRDRKRLLVSVSHAGRGFEVDLETGQVVTEYRNVHAQPTGGGDNAPEAALYSLYGMSYVED